MEDLTGMSKIPEPAATLTSLLEKILAISSETTDMPKKLIIQESHFYSYQDEKHFFEWLESIDGVKQVVGGPEGLLIQLKRNGLSRRDLYDLIALLMRYGVDMRGLKDFVTPKNKAWLTSRSAYWHTKIFGGTSRKATAARRTKSATKRRSKA
jgi:hypothetical protein